MQSNTVRSQTGSKATDNGGVTQLDGANGSSSDEDDVDDDDDDDLEEDEDKDDEEHDEDNEENQEEEPLNSEDDVSDEDPSALFETDNVVVCQYDKVIRLFWFVTSSFVFISAAWMTTRRKLPGGPWLIHLARPVE